jgi:predicted permease
MRSLKSLRLTLRSLFFRKRAEAELDEEFKFHLQQQVDFNITKGMSASEAQAAALRIFQGIELQKEGCRDARTTLFIENVLRDAKYALRVFARSPGFVIAVVLTLACGVGANTAIFSLVDAAILHPLPYPNADRIVALSEMNHKGDDLTVSWPDFLDWREQTTSFSELAALTGVNLNLTGSGLSGPAERLHGLRVSASFLSVLAAHPLLGRDFTVSDDRPGALPVAILSYELWQRRFAGDPTIIGRNINLDGRPYGIAGILPREFRFLYARDIYVPIGLGFGHTPGRGVRSVARVLGLLKPHISFGVAVAELKSISRRLAHEYPEYDDGVEATMRPFADLVAAPAERGLFALSVAVGLLLFVACANVAGLLVARAGTRQGEISVRLAVGASRGRLISQLLTESTLLALAGVVVGGVLAAATIPILVSLVPMDQGEMEQYVRVTLNLRILGFAVCLAVFTTILFGLFPAWRMPPREPGLLRSGVRPGQSGFRKLSIGSLLVTVQIALAVVLLVTAGLLGQSLLRLIHTDLGFQPDHLLTARLKVPADRYSDNARRSEFFNRLIDRIDSIPSVESASGATCLPLTGKDCWPSVVRIAGQSAARGNDFLNAHFNAVESDYLKTMRIPLISGRDFDSHDDLNHRPVVLVNQSFAHAYFPHTNPIGNRIQEGYRGNENDYEIVGLVGDARRDSPGAPPVPEVYLTARQAGPDGVELVIRTRLADPLLLSSEITRAAFQLDRDVALYDVRSMGWYINYQTADWQFPTYLLGGFSVLALALASIGLYGLMSYLVTQRNKELGIRRALGAQTAELMRMVMSQGLRLAGLGLVLGMAGAWGAARLLAALLFAVRPDDALTFVGISLLLLAVATLACWIPARRAAGVDPMLTLRAD